MLKSARHALYINPASKTTHIPHYISPLASTTLISKYNFIFGPTSNQWEKWADKKNEWIEDPNWDPRTLSKSEISSKFGFSEHFSKPVLPLLELPKNAWYTNSHMYVQQTELDDIWRVGFTPMKFIGCRHVEWLEFDCEKGDKKLYSESFLYYSVCDWFPLKTIGQSINDVQFSVSLPFHRCQIVTYNDKMQAKPSLLIDDDLHPDWRWGVVIRWTNSSEEIFDKPPIIDGRYGTWFDEKQYVEYIKDSGDYKNWQWDQCSKISEHRNLTFTGKINEEENKKWFRMKWFGSAYIEEKNDDEEVKSDEFIPKYQMLDQQLIDGEDGGTPGKKKKNWKPKWFPW